MRMNRIQFQPGLSMPEFFERYGTGAQCQTALLAARWPHGFVCPKCGGAARSHFTRVGLHKIMQATRLAEDGRELDGRIEIDDAYLGGQFSGKACRGTDDKVPLVAAVQTTADGRPLYVCLSQQLRRVADRYREVAATAAADGSIVSQSPWLVVCKGALS